MDGDQRNDTDHDGGDDQRNGNECNQHIGDGVDDLGDGGHHQSHIIRVLDLGHLVLALVVIGNRIFNDVLVLKGCRIQIDGCRVVQIDIAQRFQIVVIGGI